MPRQLLFRLLIASTILLCVIWVSQSRGDKASFNIIYYGSHQKTDLLVDD